MKMLLGIGNTLRRDDGAGNYIAHRMKETDWTAVDCGTVPENFTSVVRRNHPALLVFVDASRMGLSPGEFRRVGKEEIEDVSIGTHSLPLSHLIDFLADAAEEILFIGIEPEIVADGEGLSESVVEGAERLIEMLKKERVFDIEQLSLTRR
ncbi:hydrogenase maturation protease [Methanoculleus taiwanensis]|uniref:Hydrogenase maturation protease n=1 Tax=Methanoculleus taiwanensis TaxID=1550565 RepID=A0A498H1I5_9EURY|nr:hydrogenase maturation peptidase HycI [Methanoculleus taiwanensis]RXE56227.1 hydrogenase maturation protease [Methanoculleus taiwanensis]